MRSKSPSSGPRPESWEVNLNELAGLDEATRRRRLVAQTAHFAGTFLRWADTHSSTGLTYPRLRLLEVLEAGGPAIMRQLADQLGMSARNMTSTVDALEQAKLVERRPHPTDRRATLVQLTPGGIGAARIALRPELDAMAGIFEAFSPEEQEQYLRVLGRLYEAIRCSDLPE